MKKVNVVHTPVRFTPSIGGVENHVYYLTSELAKNNLDVKVICAKEKSQKNEIINGIKVMRLFSPFKITNTDITPSLPFVLLKEEFDIIHTHMPTPWTADISILIAKIKKKKSILTIHNDMDKPGLLPKLLTSIYLNTLFRLTIKLTDKIIIVNPSWKETFTATRNLLIPHNDKIIVIPNGVDVTIFKRNLKIAREANTILFVSILDKFHDFKGLDILFHAIKEVKNTIKKVKLIVVGEGDRKMYYEDYAQKLGVMDHVNFVGQKSQKELVDYYNKSSVFVLPSTEIEGFGIVLLEALACGLPVITSNIAGVSEEIQLNNAGEVIPVSDYHILGNAIISILKDHKRAKLFASNGVQLINDNYQWKLISNNIQKLYSSIL